MSAVLGYAALALTAAVCIVGAGVRIAATTRHDTVSTPNERTAP